MKKYICLLIVIGLFASLHLVAMPVAFAPATNYVVNMSNNSYPRAITAADVNGDGYVDLITANESVNTLSVLTNNGSGIFVNNQKRPPYGYPVGNSPTAVVAADVNGDGKMDLICTDEGGAALTVLTNDGSGAFRLAQTLQTDAGPTWITAADLNGDGKVDLISANWLFKDTLSVFTNNGSGVFSLSATLQAGFGVDSVTAVDINGDGKLDLICANPSGPYTLMVFTNNGSGGFGSNATYTVGSGPRSVLAVDVNGDSNVDLVCVDANINTLSVLTNNGNGIFGSNATYTVGLHPYWVVSADVNRDGKPDLICANGDSTLSVLTNDGSGNFTLACSPHVGSASEPSLVAADFNGDGYPDLASVNNVLQNSGNTISVLISVPTLNINSSSNNAVVSWPSSWTNWTLLQNLDLTTTNWSASQGIFDDGTNKNLTITPPNENLFFRLSHP
jgi:FG-GAP-like repeat/EF hand